MPEEKNPYDLLRAIIYRMEVGSEELPKMSNDEALRVSRILMRISQKMLQRSMEEVTTVRPNDLLFKENTDSIIRIPSATEKNN